MEPSTKRARGDDKGSARMSSKRAGKQPAVPRKSRISPRKRRLRGMADRATDEEVNAALQSPERNPSPEIVESPAPAETNYVVTSDIFPPWSRGPANPYGATVSDVLNEDISVNTFVRQLNAEAGLGSTDPNNSTNHAASSAQVTMTEAAPRPSIEVKSASRQPSPIPLISSSVPAEGREVVDEVIKDAPPAPPVGQARVEFLYRAVCRYPERQRFSWKPEGSFRNKTLAELEDELPVHLDWSHFQYLHFRLSAPNTRADQMVCRGREDQFDALKRYLAGFIRDCIADTPCGQTVFVEIDIEPLADVNSLKKSTNTEVMDFDW